MISAIQSYRHVKYTKDIDGDDVPTYQDALNARWLPYHWPSFLGRDTDSSVDLKSVRAPSIWIYGKRDGSIPVDLSIQNLKELKEDGYPVEYLVAPNAGHNNIKHTFADMVKWIKAL